MAKYDLKPESRDALIKALEKELDTRDKRFMFLRMEFKNLVSRIQLEGSAQEAAWNIFDEFSKQQMIGSLMACMNSRLDTDLYLELEGGEGMSIAEKTNSV